MTTVSAARVASSIAIARGIARSAALALVACALGQPAPEARADAIEPPPACPPGTHGRSSHAGQWCEPHPCVSDSDCEPRDPFDRILGGPAPLRCREWRVCVRTADVPLGGDHGNAPHHAEDLVVGSCDASSACDGTEPPLPPVIGTFREHAPVCTVGSYCVRDSLPPLPARASRRASSEPPRTSGVAEPPSSPGGACGVATCGSPRPAIAMLVLLATVVALASRRWR